MTQTPLRVALYARYSTDLQNPQSVADQFRQCTAYAERLGWTVTAKYEDSAISGSTSNRPGFQALTDALGAKAFDIILCESLDRISRDQEHMARFYKQAQYCDIDIYTTGRGKVDALSLGLSSTIAAIYLEELESKTRRGLAGKVAQGLSGGGLSYGYKADPDNTGELIIDKIEASVIRRILRDFADGISPLKIATALNDEGIPSPSAGSKRGSSGHWKQNTINGNAERGTGILNSELYIGRRVWNRLRYSKNPHTEKRTSKPNDPSEWQIAEVPYLRIVDRELWDAVKARQASQKKTRRKQPDTDRNRLSSGQVLRRRKYLLPGLMRCGCCGGSMTIAGTGKYKSFYCVNAKEKGASVCTGMPGLHESKASAIVLSSFREQLMRPDAYALFRDQVHEQMNKGYDAARDALKYHDARIRELEVAHRNLLAFVESGDYSAPVIERLNAVDADLKRLREARDQYVPEQTELPADLPDRYQAMIDNLAAALTDEQVAGPASDELHELLNRVVVSWDADARAHELDIEGNILGMLQKADPARLGAVRSGGIFAEIGCGGRI